MTTGPTSFAGRLAQLRAPVGPAPKPPAAEPPVGAPAGTSVADRLASLLGRDGPAPTAGGPSSTPQVSRLDALIPPRATPLGPLHLVEQRGAPWRPVAAETLEALALTEASLDGRRPLFLDTETTGLAGGTGTLAFLVGVAKVHQGAVVVEQAHLPGPGREKPLLEWLRQHLAEATLLVTFNGKSFDWPLLKSRYVMNRLPPPPAPPHLDLLHCARRVFRHDTAQCTLSALERLALGHHRQGDLDSALIPAAWFDFLRSGRVATLGRVLQHNHRDVISMVELLGVLADAWEGQRAVSGGVRLGLARVAARRRDTARALRFLGELDASDTPVGALALELKAALLRRAGDTAAAARALEAAVPLSDTPARVRLALAKLYEHQLKDYPAARAHAAGAQAAEPATSHARRLQRLAQR